MTTLPANSPVRTLVNAQPLSPGDFTDLGILLGSRWVTAMVLTRSGNRMTVIKRPLPATRLSYRVTVVFDDGSAPLTGDHLEIAENGGLRLVDRMTQQYRSTAVMRCDVTEN